MLYFLTVCVALAIEGEDLVREQMSDADDRVEFVKKLGFGYADVVVAVPTGWIRVRVKNTNQDAGQ